MRANGKDASRGIAKRPSALSLTKNSIGQRDGSIPKPRPVSANGRLTGLQNKKMHSSPNSLMIGTATIGVGPRYLMNGRRSENNEPKGTPAIKSSAGAVSSRHVINGGLTGNGEPKRPAASKPSADAVSSSYLMKGRRYGNGESKIRSLKCSPRSATQDTQAKISKINAINKMLSLGGNDATPASDSASDRDLYSNIPAYPSIGSDSCSKIMDIERASFWLSLLNLDGEDLQWISDAESGQDPFHSGFISPPRRSTSNFNFQSCDSASSVEVNNVKSQISLSSEGTPDSTKWEDLNDLDTVFWPLQQRFDCNSEKAESFFYMSPRKEVSSPTCKTIEKTGHADKDSPKCEEPKFPENNIEPVMPVYLRRKLAFGSGKLVSKILEWERRIATNMICAINAKPSKLSKSIDGQGKIDSIEIDGNIIDQADKDDIMHKLVDADRKLLEEILQSSKLNLIETLVGLSEFDGQEGIPSDVSKDVSTM